MAHGNPDLIPTVITDKTGKVTTVHRKTASQSPPSMSKVPVPTLGDIRPAQKVTKAALTRNITRVFETNGQLMKPLKSKIEKWIEHSTPQQLTVLNEAIGNSFHTVSDHEKRIIAEILNPLCWSRSQTGAMHELLALRQAFCSDWATENNRVMTTTDLESLMYGLRGGDFKTPIDLSDNQRNKENVALLRFAFELKERAPYGGFLPVRQSLEGRGRLEPVYVYDREDLKELIRQYPDRVNDLIELAVSHETCHPDRLRAMLEHEGPGTLSSGAL